ncbi:MAG: alpha/beta hydrolase [Halieaceae bacterium]|jgi:acetyl esterase|nr:alpha/beta hydrolase [Halieaceae bacterium]
MKYAFDPEFAPLLDSMPVISMEDPAAARSSMDEMIQGLNADLDLAGVVIENRLIGGPAGAPDIPLRIYSPQGLSNPVPALLYLHGGGFVLGNLDSEHSNCVALCRDLGIVLVSVDYRLAPETPYPNGLEDCYVALEWTAAQAAALHIDSQRLGVMGSSAGGGLAAATALLARDRNGPVLCFQYLGIPELDDRLHTPSMEQFVDTPLWNRPSAEWSWDYYLGNNWRRGGDTVPYYAAPARAGSENLAGLPPAHVTTMEFDPLRDEGILYALSMMQAGVSVELHSYPGTFHGSSLMSFAQVSQREATEMRLSLRRGLMVD